MSDIKNNGSKKMIEAVDHYRRLGFSRGKRSPLEIGAFLHGYYKRGGERADRLFAVCLLFLFLRANERQEELRMLLWICDGMRKRNDQRKLDFWIKAYARKNYYDVRTAYRHWKYLLSLYSKLLGQMR